MAKLPIEYQIDYPETNFSPEFIQKHGVMENVLGAFLEAQMKEIQNLLQQNYPTLPEAALPKLLGQFVTLEGTKRPMALAKISSPDLSKTQVKFCLEKMETARILRQEEGIYEVAHDTLALYIAKQRGAEEIAFLEIVKMIKDRHQVFPKTQTLLNANELELVRYNKSALEKEAVLNVEEWNYITKSKQEKKHRLRLRQLLTLGLIGILSTFSVFSYWQRNIAQEKEKEAIAARQAAEENLQQLKIEQAQKIEAKYKEHLALGQSLMAQDNYLGAIKELETALVFNESGAEALRLITEASSKAGVDNRFEQLLREGADLEANGAATLVDARTKYLLAQQLDFDKDLVNEKLKRLEVQLEKAFDEFLKDGDAFFEAKSYEFALKNYQQALRIKPGKELKLKIDRCKSKIGL